ncbi:hypothetical protein Pen02_33120 [Plantactinospora endophytica]|uniref:Uncharacterized protein n=1 Tax=Plantactinospora endophytica TaxID=673535 RepID=A0ABQ4E116_9ACTN|nr:hypothetical protein Pen02_33120 [Plantactinospora endophytica]
MPHTASYECSETFAQTSAATMASTSTPALPDSVRAKRRNGAAMSCAQAVRPDNRDEDGSVTGIPRPVGYLHPGHEPDIPGVGRRTRRRPATDRRGGAGLSQCDPRLQPEGRAGVDLPRFTTSHLVDWAGRANLAGESAPRAGR